MVRPEPRDISDDLVDAPEAVGRAYMFLSYLAEGADALYIGRADNNGFSSFYENPEIDIYRQKIRVTGSVELPGGSTGEYSDRFSVDRVYLDDDRVIIHVDSSVFVFD